MQENVVQLVERMRRYRKHTLGKKEERLLAMQGEMSQAAGKAFRQLLDADLKFGSIKDDARSLDRMAPVRREYQSDRRDEQEQEEGAARPESHALIIRGWALGSTPLRETCPSRVPQDQHRGCSTVESDFAPAPTASVCSRGGLTV